jgi:hypothetical protein
MSNESLGYEAYIEQLGHELEREHEERLEAELRHIKDHIMPRLVGTEKQKRYTMHLLYKIHETVGGARVFGIVAVLKTHARPILCNAVLAHKDNPEDFLLSFLTTPKET